MGSGEMRKRINDEMTQWADGLVPPVCSWGSGRSCSGRYMVLYSRDMGVSSHEGAVLAYNAWLSVDAAC